MKARNPSTGTLDTVYVKALDSMPVGTEVDFVGNVADIPAGWEEVNDYSTSEVNTGRKWIDGKTIYRRVYSGTLTSTSTTLGVISNFDTLVNCYGSYLRNGYWNTINIYWENNFKGIVQVKATGNNIGTVVVSVGDGVSSYTLILEYTKTTD